MNEQKLRNSLNHIVQNEPHSIKALVAKEALKRKNIKRFFYSVAKRGCISGLIDTLNRYEQTHQFFETYYEEIEVLRIAVEKQTDKPINLEYDLKTTLSWFAFEETARLLASELGVFENE